VAGVADRSFPLSKAPDGLLGALDLKSLGHNPQDFGDVLSPSFETTPYYLLRNRLAIQLAGPWVAVNTPIVFAAGTGVAAPYSVGGLFVCPQKEVLRIKQLTVIVARAAADVALTLEMGVWVRRINSPTAVAIGVGIFGPRPATDTSTWAAIPLNEYWWLGPGDSIAIQPNTTQTAAGSGISLNVDFDTMPSG